MAGWKTKWDLKRQLGNLGWETQHWISTLCWWCGTVCLITGTVCGSVKHLAPPHVRSFAWDEWTAPYVLWVSPCLRQGCKSTLGPCSKVLGKMCLALQGEELWPPEGAQSRVTASSNWKQPAEAVWASLECSTVKRPQGRRAQGFCLMWTGNSSRCTRTNWKVLLRTGESGVPCVDCPHDQTLNKQRTRDGGTVDLCLKWSQMSLETTDG